MSSAEPAEPRAKVIADDTFGAFNRTTLPGLNYHAPWPVESAETPAVTRINRVEVGFRAGPRKLTLSA